MNKLSKIIAVILTVIIFSYIFKINIYRNSSTSMEPKISKQSYCLTLKVPYSKYQTNDIVVSEVNLEKFNLKKDQLVIKRVIAKENDIVEVKNSCIYVNGSVLYKEIGVNDTPLKVTIPKDFYFLIGDNVKDSFDSRNYGIIHISSLKGKVVFIKNMTEN